MSERLRWSLIAVGWVALDAALWAGAMPATDWWIEHLARGMLDHVVAGGQPDYASGGVRVLAFILAYIGAAVVVNALLLALVVRDRSRRLPGDASQRASATSADSGG